VNDDPLPSLSIGNVAVPEGDSGPGLATFTVTLSAASAQTVSVDVASADGTAAAGTDYSPLSQLITFAPGVTTQTVAVTILGDTASEADETFLVTLSGATNATLGTAQGVGTILNDDAAELSAAADAHVRNGLFSASNFGTAKRLEVKTTNFPAGFARRSYLRFDLRGVAATSVSRATLRVFVSGVDGRRSRFKAFPVVNDAWGETRITWLNKPAPGVALASAIVSAPGWVTLDVTAFVNAQLAGDRRASFALLDDTNTKVLVRLHSREATTNTPVLTLIP